MKNNLLASLLTLGFTLALIGTAPIVHSEEAIAAANEANSASGKEKSGTCANCHGEDGNSTMPTFPKLSEQHAAYLAKQLYAFKDGSRKDPVMAPMAMALTDADIADISKYYSKQKISTNPEPTLPVDEDSADSATDEKKAKDAMQALLLKGSNLYRNGNLASAVSACIACHGPSGEGNKPATFPALRSQHADYLIKTLTDFKNGIRSANPENMMYMITKKMTDEEIKAVSYYISTMN